MEPIARFEIFLAVIAGESYELPVPQTRVELFLANIAGESYELPAPEARVELYLAKILGQNVTLPVPQSRIDRYLAAIAGEAVDPPEYWTTRVEYWLAKWAEGSGGQIVTVTGVAPLLLQRALAKQIRSLTQYGLCTQSTTPTPSAPVDIVCNNGALRMLNLANMAESNLDIGYYLNNSGVRTSSPLNFYTLGFIPVKPSTAYTMKTSESLNYFNIMEYDSAKGFLNRTLWGASGSPAGDTVTFTTRSDTAFIRFGSNMNGNTLTYADIAAVTWMLTEGATAQDYVPYGQLSIVGTPEVLSVGLNEWAVYETGYLNVGGGISSNANYGVTDYLPAKAGEKWLFGVTFTAEVPGAGLRYCFYDSTKKLIGERQGGDTPSAGVYNFEATAPSGAAFVRVSNNIQISAKNQLVIREPQTVTDIPMLLSVNDYKDESEIISGLLTHKVGIKVLDATESWALSDRGSTHRFRGTKPSDCHTPASRAPSVCTHFKYVSTGSAVGGMFIDASQYWYFIPTDQTIDTVDKWTAWVAEQYAAGTPVIVIYPLAEETTEQTQDHALHTSEGDNVVDVTANVSPVELKAEFTQASA